MRRFVVLMLLASAALPGLACAQASPNPPPAMQGPGDVPLGPPLGAPPGPPHHGPGGLDHGKMEQKMHDRFNAANTTHDGHLTLAQAKAANLKPVVDHFADIDTAQRGYVTFNQVEAWHLDDMAKHLEKRAAELRAQG